ncbi:hypothetical protein [Methanobacterium paludis]|uniref:hypothetical protein n=1 Tax=Methanobacterium paludis (strain DSM 25820 / JCM 18151 / SWAN1) TaxID=868131 RepID=UPI000AF03676|nr:hypothetical protein [Methanobacterium paludis]
MPKRKNARKYPRSLGHKPFKKFKIATLECGNTGTANSKTKRVIAIAKTPSTKVSKRSLSLISSSIRVLRLSSTSDKFGDIKVMLFRKYL